MIGRLLCHAKPEKVTQPQRVCHPPGNSPLGVDAFKEANQQHAEIGTWGQSGPGARTVATACLATLIDASEPKTGTKRRNVSENGCKPETTTHWPRCAAVRI